MKSGGEGCQRVFTIPAIVEDHAKRKPVLKKEIENFCKADRGRTCHLPYSNGATDFTPLASDFCSFQNKIGKLKSTLNALRAHNSRWAEKAQTVWQEKAKKFGMVRTVTTQHHSDSSLGEIVPSTFVPQYGTRIFLDVGVLAMEADQEGAREYLDGGFALWFDSAGQAHQWLKENFAKLPSVFSSCAPRLDFIEMRRNRQVDDLYHCWEKRAKARGIQNAWLAWQTAFHPTSILGYAP